MAQKSLLTEAIRIQLEKNYAANFEKEDPTDFKPVVKLFFPAGRGTWLLTELGPNNIAFGLADLGEPELGYIDLNELASVRVHGLKVERDLYFKADKTLSQYADEARASGMLIA